MWRWPQHSHGVLWSSWQKRPLWWTFAASNNTTNANWLEWLLTPGPPLNSMPSMPPPLDSHVEAFGWLWAICVRVILLNSSGGLPSHQRLWWSSTHALESNGVCWVTMLQQPFAVAMHAGLVCRMGSGSWQDKDLLVVVPFVGAMQGRGKGGSKRFPQHNEPKSAPWCTREERCWQPCRSLLIQDEDIWEGHETGSQAQSLFSTQTWHSKRMSSKNLPAALRTTDRKGPMTKSTFSCSNNFLLLPELIICALQSSSKLFMTSTKWACWGFFFQILQFQLCFCIFFQPCLLLIKRHLVLKWQQRLTEAKNKVAQVLQENFSCIFLFFLSRQRSPTSMVIIVASFSPLLIDLAFCSKLFSLCHWTKLSQIQSWKIETSCWGSCHWWKHKEEPCCHMGSFGNNFVALTPQRRPNLQHDDWICKFSLQSWLQISIVCHNHLLFPHFPHFCHLMPWFFWNQLRLGLIFSPSPKVSVWPKQSMTPSSVLCLSDGQCAMSLKTVVNCVAKDIWVSWDLKPCLSHLGACFSESKVLGQAQSKGGMETLFSVLGQGMENCPFEMNWKKNTNVRNRHNKQRMDLKILDDCNQTLTSWRALRSLLSFMLNSAPLLIHCNFNWQHELKTSLLFGAHNASEKWRMVVMHEQSSALLAQGSTVGLGSFWAGHPFLWDVDLFTGPLLLCHCWSLSSLSLDESFDCFGESCQEGFEGEFQLD